MYSFPHCPGLILIIANAFKEPYQSQRESSLKWEESFRAGSPWRYAKNDNNLLVYIM